MKHAFIAALCLLTACTVAQAAGAPFAWPHGAKAAVSLAYDDAIDSQLDNALPMLDGADLKASFYLTLASPTLVKRLPEWRAAAARGHELGNHSLFHQCIRDAGGHAWVTPENDLATTSAERMAAQVRLGNAMLHLLTADEFDSAEAYRLNFVQKVVPAGQELDAALAIAQRIAAQAPLAVVATRLNVIKAVEQGPLAAVSEFIETQKRLSNSDDAAEGVRSFVERRPARFSGR